MTETIVKKKINTNIKEPVKYHVIYFDDDVTTMDFVVMSLIDIFDYDMLAATDLMLEVHNIGQSIVATLPFEVAEHRQKLVLKMAAEFEFPLKVEIQPDE